jgi:hypothetical protein
MSRFVLECLGMMNNDEFETQYHAYGLHIRTIGSAFAVPLE